jgi:hypothetical protein
VAPCARGLQIAEAGRRRPRAPCLSRRRLITTSLLSMQSSSDGMSHTERLRSLALELGGHDREVDPCSLGVGECTLGRVRRASSVRAISPWSANARSV